MVQAITNETTSNQKVDQTFSFTTFKSRKLIRRTKATELIVDKSVHKYNLFCQMFRYLQCDIYSHRN